MAANQASEISEKDVRVIPTTSIPQGITCVTMFNQEAEVDENEEEYANAEVEAHEEVAAEAKKYAFVTVAMGEGISNIFKDLGVDYVIGMLE